MEVHRSKSLESLLAKIIPIAMESPQQMKHAALVFSSKKKPLSLDHNSNNRTKVGSCYSPSHHAEKACISRGVRWREKRKESRFVGNPCQPSWATLWVTSM